MCVYKIKREEIRKQTEREREREREREVPMVMPRMTRERKAYNTLDFAILISVNIYLFACLFLSLPLLILDNLIPDLIRSVQI